ncbi:hypothetical protein HF086_006950 [Spodoptera exigua]|uniref:Uncharacterized protein n=1 Tax=Spodoptera exigua TaxID=7107 RepID=A0A922SGX8_SPOEX|nr:hypothetical protein HF086_006950 [Spodoptera exigua]
MTAFEPEAIQATSWWKKVAHHILYKKDNTLDTVIKPITNFVNATKRLLKDPQDMDSHAELHVDTDLQLKFLSQHLLKRGIADS